MSELIRCEACRRHVRVGDAACPFCESATGTQEPIPGASKRLGRAALFAFGTTLAGCAGTPVYGIPPQDADIRRLDAGADAGSTDSGAGLDAGTDSGTADAGLDAGTDSGTADAGADAGAVEPDGGIFPPYGAPADPTAWV